MKRPRYALAAVALLAALITQAGHAAGPFDQKLTGDRPIIHALSRLTFGPRPGDVEAVRAAGLESWIAAQLHPERVAENPLLEAKLRPLETVTLPHWQIVERFQQAPQVMAPQQRAQNMLSPQQRNTLGSGSAEERLTTLASLSPADRQLLLAGAPPAALNGLPEAIQQEAVKARQLEQEAYQAALRKAMPPIGDLLNADQMRIANRGSAAEKTALVNSFDAEKRKQVLRMFPQQALNDVPQLRREAMAIRQPQEFVNTELIEHKLNRAIYSNRQLEEVLVDFWVNHFNIFNGKGLDRVLLTGFERDAIRPNVFGRFEDMLLATARHPAMLLYLDNYLSQVQRDDQPQQGPPNGAPARRPGLNENYGREIMELHTLGVDGGYTQDDVIAVARAFSGWTIYDQGKYAEYQFNNSIHDRKEKVVLGRTLPAGRGEQDGLDVIGILAHHPSTARFISKKLAQRFVADDPPAQLVNRMAETFTRTDGDLRAVLQTMLASVEFMSEGAWQAKLKSPLEIVVSAVRAVNTDVSDTFPLSQRIAELGQPLYGKLEPTGYPNTGEQWASTSGFLGRINFMTALAGGQIPGATVNLSRFNFKEPAWVAREILGMPPSPATLTAIQNGIEGKEATPSMLVTLVMSSPDFQRR